MGSLGAQLLVGKELHSPQSVGFVCHTYMGCGQRAGDNKRLRKKRDQGNVSPPQNGTFFAEETGSEWNSLGQVWPAGIDGGTEWPALGQDTGQGPMPASVSHSISGRPSQPAKGSPRGLPGGKGPEGPHLGTVS